ncbi:Protein of unknown function [Cotesia congregata]|uniref:Uncharacterized protein n=1 Tax=Cotesia congregata TaxID=51543 RepID=A0A8J2H6Y4_COTCN|nr:Protein of unknown function [Cotesia congregata]
MKKTPIVTHNQTLSISFWLGSITALMIIRSTANFFYNIDKLHEVSCNLGYILPYIATSLKGLVVYRNQKAFFELINKVHGPIKKLKYSSGKYDDLTPFPMFKIIYAIKYYVLVMNIMCVLVHDPVVIGVIRWIKTQLVVLQSNFRDCNNFNTPRATFSMSSENYNIALDYKYFKTPEELREIQTFIPFAEEVRVDQDSFIKRFKLCMFHYRLSKGNVMSHSIKQRKAKEKHGKA